jgi:hypothetical protein
MAATNNHWNQIKENTVCNSNSYNDVYSKNRIRKGLYSIKSWVDISILHRNMVLFSKMLDIDISGNNHPTVFNKGREFNRTALQIASEVILHRKDQNTFNPEYVMFNVAYRYQFNTISTNYSYIQGKKYDIYTNGKFYKCIDVLPNNLYVFESPYINFFHFSFHIPNSNLDKSQKFRGAFHLRADHLSKILGSPSSTHTPLPYRSFIVDPRSSRGEPHFVLWDEMDQVLDTYFTTTDPTLHLDEISLFLLKNPGIVINHTIASGASLRFVDHVLRPIYNIIVTNILNPLTAVSTLVFQPPCGGGI